MSELLKDAQFTKAVSNVLVRSEREPNLEELERTYVDTGVLPQLDNANNQILFGRRGTGKSHVLRVLGARTTKATDGIAVYIDMRTLGSAHQVLDPTQPLAQRCINVFKDLLTQIYYALLDVATDPSSNASDSSLERISELERVITEVARLSTGRDVTREATATSKEASNIGVNLGPQAASVSMNVGGEAGTGARISETYHELFESNVVFGQVQRTLDEAVAACGVSRLLVLIDEWTALPQDVQPYVAEFIRRTLLTAAAMVVKIASLEYRSRLSIPLSGNSVIGFEVGGDIAANLDLDDYYVYDRNPDSVMGSFEEVLFRHLAAELPDNYLKASYGVSDAQALRARLFTEVETFRELVRAGEGVVRDFISIFQKAFFEAQRRGRSSIDVKAVREAARLWYETDKAVNLSDQQQSTLQRITTEVIGSKQARSFMVERTLSRHHLLQSLFDFRIVHLVSRGYSDKSNPGLRYNIYTLDYGTYVDLIQTRKQPQLYMQEVEDSGEDRVVPFDDKRSIRTIILSRDVLGPDATNST